MKKYLLKSTLAVALLALIWSCDNGNADPVIIDGPPTIELGAITSGTVEGQDFTMTVTFSDGIDGSTISSLASASYTVTNVDAGTVAAQGDIPVSGDNITATISIAGGFTPGNYNIDIQVADSNGNASNDNVSFSVGSASPDFDISGDWRMEPVEGAFKVGPAPGSGEWWQNSEGDVATRACHFDDVYTFSEGASGTFSIDMGDATWLETFQGVDSDQCGTPVDPFVSGDYTFTYTETQLTLIGRGAAVGLAKVNNEGEISQGAAVADQITYNIASQTVDGDNRRMTLQIEAADGVWWEFLLISGPPAESPLVGTWRMAPEAGALAVGPTAGSNAWWENNADDVTTRACYFDDTWTFDAMGNMTINMGDQTWLETWQGVGEGCGAPLAPFVNDTYNYTFAGDQLTVTGVGAFIGLQKVTNSAEIPSLDDAVGEITYTVSEITANSMTLQINYNPGGEGWWQFKLVKD